MTQYLVAIHLTDDFDPVTDGNDKVSADISALNEEMVAAGVRVFVGGLAPVAEAKSARLVPGGKVRFTDGPYIEAKEHVGGFWVLELGSLDEALEWGRKAVIACRAPVEVRPFN